MSVTLDDLRRRVIWRTRVNVGTGEWLDYDELDHYINQSLGELYDLLIEHNYFQTDGYAITTISGRSNYDLPVNFYKSMGVNLNQGGYTITLQQYNFGERNYYRNSNFFINLNIPELFYRIQDSEINFYPVPGAGLGITLDYIPQMTKLVASSDKVKNTIIESWLEYVEVDVAMKIMIIEETDYTPYAAVKQQLMQRIVSLAESRNWGEPTTITDVNKIDRWWYR